MEMFYTVLEIQESDNGVRACLPTIYTDYNAAMGKLYTVLSAAAVSGIPYHSGHILRSDGVMTDGRVFDRRVVEPTPEPEPEPEEV